MCKYLSSCIFVCINNAFLEKTASIQQGGILQGSDLMQGYKAKGLFFQKTSCTYKLSPSRFMSSKTNE